MIAALTRVTSSSATRPDDTLTGGRAAPVALLREKPRSPALRGFLRTHHSLLPFPAADAVTLTSHLASWLPAPPTTEDSSMSDIQTSPPTALPGSIRQRSLASTGSLADPIDENRGSKRRRNRLRRGVDRRASGVAFRDAGSGHFDPGAAAATGEERGSRSMRPPPARRIRRLRSAAPVSGRPPPRTP